MMVSEEEKDLLRRVAMEAAKRATGIRAAAGSLEIPAGSILLEPAPVFVTWLKDGRLRGRSGTIEAKHALAAAVEEHAVAALLHDPRIPPVTTRDLPRHVPEISVLFTFEEIFSSSSSSSSEANISSLLPGTHGVVAEKGKRRGVVLPQDATGFDWDAARLLSQACLRAGLPEESWRAPGGPRLLRFVAEVF